MRALRRFTVRVALPEQLAALSGLATNLRWSWHQPTRDVFAAVDPDLWSRVGGDPVRLIGEVSAERLAELSADARFLDRLRAAREDLAAYLDRPAADAPPVAYFSPEFGITEVLPQYSGGLGILAGDHLKSASDLGVPIIGVGLLYRSGYFVQSLTHDGWQQEEYPAIDPAEMPLTLLPDRVSVDLPEGRRMVAQVWLAKVGRVPLLLLDTDVDDNEPAERAVTDRLYGGGADHRLRQELLLGVGGVRAVRAYSAATGAPEPRVYHTNEGHAGFLGLERIRELISDTAGRAGALDFDEALAAVRAGTVFTTHTPVPAGIDRFGRQLVADFLAAALPRVPVDRALALGAEDDPNVFNMAHMGLRLAQRANGVSALHGQVSREMFAALWPGFDTTEPPITHVTNGVHAATWAPVPPSPDLSDDDLWAVRRDLRGQLVAETRRRLRASCVARGSVDAELGWVDETLDPDVLTIGFARRVPSYKRLTLMLTDRERLRRLLLHPDRPVQLVIAGKAHPADDGGKRLIQELVRFADDAGVRHRIVFLPDYDMALARYLVTGVDVWLNNPVRPLEASGTSGMKAALNGGLNLSIRDGWWDEMFEPDFGWAIPTANGVIDGYRRDELEAAALYELLETRVAPLFYAGRDRWLGMVRRTLRDLGPQVLADRMVSDYVTKLYRPAAAAAGRMAAEGYAAARRLADWSAKVRAAWNDVRVVHVESTATTAAPALGESLILQAQVDLGALSPDDVEVQACTGRVDGDHLMQARCTGMRAVDGTGRYEATVPLTRAGVFGYTVRVVPRSDLLASPVELGLVRYA